MMNDSNQEEIIEQLQNLLYERGHNALELAQKTVLEEKIESKQVKEAMIYFINDYWKDVTRPALLSLLCEAVGGEPELTTPIGVSMILIAGGIDIHDDIIDESKTKESKLTVYGKYGKNIALLVGDAFMFQGYTVLNNAVENGIPADQISRISSIIKRTFFELGDAEALELPFRGRLDVTSEEYLHVVRKKAADVEAYAKISAIVGGGSEEEVEAFGDYGRILGMLVILRDDMIDMLDPEETIHRIQKEHLSLAIVYALENPKLKTLVTEHLKQTTDSKTAGALSLIVDDAGGFSKLHDCMIALANQANNKIDIAKYNKNYLASLIQGMLLPNWRSYLAPEDSNG